MMYKDSSYKEAKWKEITEIFTSQQGRGHKEMEVIERYLC